jgi:hypothetical protein
MPSKRESPGVRMKKAGYKQVGPLWLTGAQFDQAQEAAAAAGLPLTQAFIRAGLKWVEKKLSEKHKKIAKKT